MADGIKLEGAPYWYGTPLDELDFEWSLEEELELEYYCEGILKNIAEEDMTPRQRFEATMDGKDRDRLLLEALYFNQYAVRSLDSATGAFKPADVCQDPKLLVKAHMATLSRFALDFPTLYPISYTHEFWGGKAQTTEYGNPYMVGGPPIKSVADLEGIEVPNPAEEGLYSGYLWACREISRIFHRYGVDKVMPIGVSVVGPMATVIESMIGWNEFIRAVYKDKELCQQTMNLATEWVIRLGKAVNDMGTDCLMICDYPGIISIEGNEWMVEYYTDIGKALGSKLPLWYALTFEKAISWFTTMYERGAAGTNSFRGWFCADMDYKEVVNFSRDHGLYCSCAISDKVLLNGPTSAIEEEIKQRCDYGKANPKFAVGIAAVDYSTPISNFEDAIAAAKRHGRLN